MILDYLGGPSVISRVLKSRRSQKREPERAVGELGLTLLTLKLEEEAASRGMWATSRSWKRRGTDSPLALQQERSPADILILASETHFRLFASRTTR